MAKQAVVGDMGTPVTAPCSLCGHTQLPAAWGTDTKPSVSALHGQIQQFLWKLPLQERDWPWRYYFASVRKRYFNSSLWKENCKWMIVFSSHAAKSCLKQFALEAEHIKYTPQLQPAAACWGKTTPATLNPCCSDSLTMFILHYDAGLVHSLPNYYVTN